MESDLHLSRASGVLAHISSLPSPFGIGDIGAPSIQFLDYLEAAGQKYWQILPTGPTNLVFDSSPYMSSSAFAGSPLLISPQSLYDAGLISRAALGPDSDFSPYFTKYESVATYKTNLLKLAFQEFKGCTNDSFTSFVSTTPWLVDYALFMALKEAFHGKPWYEWPKSLARQPNIDMSQYIWFHFGQTPTFLIRLCYTLRQIQTRHICVCRKYLPE